MSNLRFRPAVHSLPRYVPGKSAPGAVKISSNEMPTPPSPAVLEAVARELETINRYPDLTAAPLREALGERFGVGSDQVCVGTGSSAILVAALSTVCQPGTRVVFPWRSFESYPIAVPSVGGEATPVALLPDGSHDLVRMRQAITADTVAVILCSPNNPTGNTIRQADVARVCEACPGLVLVDEAYIEFADAGVSAQPLLEDYDNLIILHTLSKAYCLAGGRVGYLLANEQILEALEAVRQPYSVNAFSQAAALTVVENREAFQPCYRGYQG